MEVLEVDVLVVGAGVVGLACARELSLKIGSDKTICVVDRHFKYGQEASSHNSEVIHAGIYYKPGSNKAKLCLEGKSLLYEYCDKFNLPYKRCGKYILPTEAGRESELEKIFKNASENGAGVEYRSFKTENPSLKHLEVGDAIWSPSTGIVDSHELMKKLEAESVENGVLMLYRHEIKGYDGYGYLLVGPNGEEVLLKAKAMINSAGLFAGKILKMVWPESSYEIKPCRGRYYSMSGKWTGQFSELLYPLPDPRGGLGVHLTVDMSGRCRLGPDVDWSGKEHQPPNDMILYKFDEDQEALQREFHTSGQRLIRDLKFDELSPDYVGVRAKLFKSTEAEQEFTFVEREDVPSLHLLGIESPGVTASLAIGKKVAATVTKNLLQ